jgi:putative SOS response-associated peptidase YedK
VCTLYTMTSNAEAIARLFEVKGALPNLPAYDAIYPDREAPVVRVDEDGRREIAKMLWGYPPPPNGNRPVVNVRNLSSPFWRSSLVSPRHRCLVPVTAFSEWTAEPDPATGRKRKVWFGLTDEDELPFAFAGVWRRADGAEGPAMRMAFLTCEPNPLVGRVHPKAMPVILAREDYARWLGGSLNDALALARPYPAERMVIVDEPRPGAWAAARP